MDIFQDRDFPAYAYRPGRHPHPTQHPDGHSYGVHHVVTPGDWEYGLRLFDAGYYWEAHEAWEGLWQQLPSHTDEARFLQALIQLAAALLKRECGNLRGALSLWKKAQRTLPAPGPSWRGVDLKGWLQQMHAFPAGGTPPSLA